MKPFTSAEAKAALAAVPEWSRQGRLIGREYAFADFPTAIRFVNAVAKLAIKAAHHPGIDVQENRVTLVLTTHDVAGLTDRDFALAAAADRAALKLPAAD